MRDAAELEENENVQSSFSYDSAYHFLASLLVHFFLS